MVGYTPNNQTEEFKKYNLWLFVSDTSNKNHFKFFEFHSGEGIYRLENGESYEGSSFLVLNTIQKRTESYEAHLNEKDKERKKKLSEVIKNVFENVEINSEWQKSFKKYLRAADENSFFFIDPTYIRDYRGAQGIIKKLPKLLRTKAKIALYVPETISFPAHKQVISTIEKLIEFHNKDFVHLKNFENDTRGFLKRTDHLYFVYKK